MLVCFLSIMKFSSPQNPFEYNTKSVLMKPRRRNIAMLRGWGFIRTDKLRGNLAFEQQVFFVINDR